ncbi:MAG: hypothetical protein ACYC35_12215 [Pirellulales bacterium]
MTCSRWRVLAFLFPMVFALAGRPAIAAESPPAGLAFAQQSDEFRFDTGVLKGTFRAGGKSLGLTPVRDAASGTEVAGAFGLFSPYRLLTADARFGTAAWDWASRAVLLPDGSVQVRWTADKDHPLELTGVYRWTAPGTLDLRLLVEPKRDLARFELFLASYFSGFSEASAWVASQPGGDGKPGFMEAKKAGSDWQTFPRDEKTAAIFADGRWNRPPNPVAWTIMPRLEAPLAVRRDGKTGLAAVLMAQPDDCFAVSMPYGEETHRSVYLSLFGRDLKAGHQASARARLVLGKNISDAQAVELYRVYLRK